MDMKKKLLMKLLEDYQPFMYNNYTNDSNVGDFSYLNEVADAILRLDVIPHTEDKCPACKENMWEYNKIHDSRRCLKCGGMQTKL